MLSGVVTSSSAANFLTMSSNSLASRRPSVYSMKSLMLPLPVSTSITSLWFSGQCPAFTSYWLSYRFGSLGIS